MPRRVWSRYGLPPRCARSIARHAASTSSSTSTESPRPASIGRREAVRRFSGDRSCVNMNRTEEPAPEASVDETIASNRPALLIVEDEAAIVTPLVEGLERSGFDVTVARTGGEAL